MLRTNLSTRPFYNERGVRAGIGALALVALGLTDLQRRRGLAAAVAEPRARQAVAQQRRAGARASARKRA